MGGRVAWSSPNPIPAGLASDPDTIGTPWVKVADRLMVWMVCCELVVSSVPTGATTSGRVSMRSWVVPERLPVSAMPLMGTCLGSLCFLFLAGGGLVGVFPASTALNAPGDFLEMGFF